MRYTHYFRRTHLTGEAASFPFSADDFKAAGFLPSSFGMAGMEALMLVNKWNAQTNDRFTYWLQ